MRAILQRVARASVKVDGYTTGSIDRGLLLLCGFTSQDDHDDMEYILRKVLQMRIFSDAEGKMNLSVQDIGGSILLVSQFTLYASTKKGNRPSFIHSAPADQAQVLYDEFVHMAASVIKCETGRFGADMQVELINDGPVTIYLDSKDRQ